VFNVLCEAVNRAEPSLTEGADEDFGDEDMPGTCCCCAVVYVGKNGAVVKCLGGGTLVAL
jgi:hypothetical protein